MSRTGVSTRAPRDIMAISRYSSHLDMYFTIVPEPGTILLLAFGASMCFKRKPRSVFL